MSERFTIERRNSNWVHKTYYVIRDCGKEDVIGLKDKKEAHDVCHWFNFMNNRLQDVLSELYEKDRRIEELGGCIEYGE